jgi:hypothetical protein
MIFFFSACGTQPYLHQNSAFIVLKTPTMRYADQGFVYENPDEVKVEIYSSGQALFSLRVTKDSVCTGVLSCMGKEAFTKNVLSPHYPSETIEAVFRQRPVFGGKNLIKKRNGFTQELINGHKYHIQYSVLNNETVFRDTINHILIKIKRL